MIKLRLNSISSENTSKTSSEIPEISNVFVYKSKQEQNFEKSIQKMVTVDRLNHPQLI